MFDQFSKYCTLHDLLRFYNFSYRKKTWLVLQKSLKSEFLPHCNGDKPRRIKEFMKYYYNQRGLSSKSRQIVDLKLGQTSKTLFVSKLLVRGSFFTLNLSLNFSFIDVNCKTLRQNQYWSKLKDFANSEPNTNTVAHLALSSRKNLLKLSWFCFDLSM